jgi:hypothetical protein
MTNTLPSSGPSSARRARAANSGAHESAVGLQKHRRTATDLGLALIAPLLGQDFLDKYKLRDPLNRGLRYGVKRVFSVVGATNRQFKRVSGATGAPTTSISPPTTNRK